MEKIQAWLKENWVIAVGGLGILVVLWLYLRSGASSTTNQPVTIGPSPAEVSAAYSLEATQSTNAAHVAEAEANAMASALGVITQAEQAVEIARINAPVAEAQAAATVAQTQAAADAATQAARYQAQAQESAARAAQNSNFAAAIPGILGGLGGLGLHL